MYSIVLQQQIFNESEEQQQQQQQDEQMAEYADGDGHEDQYNHGGMMYEGDESFEGGRYT